MSGDSWRGRDSAQKDPAKARAKAFGDLQETTARVESAQERLREAKSEKNASECELSNAETAYSKAKATLEKLLPGVRPARKGVPHG